MRVPEAKQVFVHHSVDAEAQDLKASVQSVSLQTQDFFHFAWLISSIKSILGFFAQLHQHLCKLSDEGFVAGEVVLLFAHTSSIAQSFGVERLFLKKITHKCVIVVDGWSQG